MTKDDKKNTFSITLHKKLSDRETAGLLRRETVFPPTHAPDRINFAGNDYLGLSHHHDIINAFKNGIDRYGVSSCASRLITGTTEAHTILEREIAVFKQTESAVLFASGFQANSSVIPALCRSGDVILSDYLNHASLIDGIRLATALHRNIQFKRYRHIDMQHLKELLHEYADRRVIIITDSVFSMEGDYAPLDTIVACKEQHRNAIVYIDEAHATGILGAHGRGAIEHFGISPQHIDIIMGTFSKALGCFGAYVCGTNTVTEYIRNFTRGYIYSTAFPPAQACACSAALHVLQNNSSLRIRLRTNIHRLHSQLRHLGFTLPSFESHITTILLGDNNRALAYQKKLAERGFHVSAIRPPTVPPNTARLRITLSAAHTADEIDALCTALHEIKQDDKSNDTQI